MAQCRCGTSDPDDASFCSTCGVARSGPSALLGASSTISTVTTGGGVDRRWMVIGLAVLAGAMGWSAWASGAPTSGAHTDDALTEEAVTTTWEPPTTSGPTVTSNDATSTDATSTDATSTDVLRRSTPSSHDVPTSSFIGTGGPLLGEPTGLQLIVGKVATRPLVLDLDTGELVAAPQGVGGVEPLMSSGEWLLARRDARLVSLPVDDLAADPVELLPDDAGSLDLADMAPRTDGTAWVAVEGEATRFVLVDLATGEALESDLERVDPFNSPTWSTAGPAAAFALVDHSAGGVYVFDGAGYRQVTDGRLIVADGQRLLAEDCDERLQCGRHWFDRERGEPLDLMTPPEDADQLMFLHGSDWLLVVHRTMYDMSSEMFDVSTGRVQGFGLNRFDGTAGRQPAMSADGRWMAMGAGSELVIVDLETGVEHRFDGLDVWYQSMVFATSGAGYALPPVEVLE